jgi:hypothetical protein
MLLIVGFCCAELNELGPVQLYVTPDVDEAAVRLSVCVEQRGPLLPAVGVAGVGGSLSTTGPIALEEHEETDAIILL